MITASLAASLYRVSYQAANTPITTLVNKGVLRQYTSGRYDRISQCDSVLAALDH